MDWSNERYVRLFTRDTPEWMCMDWQGRAVWPLLIRKADRSGVIANKLGTRGVAVLIGLPLEVVEPGLKSLLDDGCLQIHQLGYVIPNFIEAQETPQSDAQRQRESRERRRVVTNRDSESLNVTECHAVSRGVTSGHAVSRPVTPDQTSPDQTDLSGATTPEPEPNPVLELARVVIAEIARLAGRKFDPEAEVNMDLCRKLIRKRRTIDEIMLVIQSKKNWIGDPKMHEWFQPSTLLGAQKFARYLDEARAGPARPVNGHKRFASTTTDDEPDLSSYPKAT